MNREGTLAKLAIRMLNCLGTFWFLYFTLFCSRGYLGGIADDVD